MSGEAATVAVRPIYSRHASDPAQPWRLKPDWGVMQRLDHPDPEAANRLALLDLEGGADGLALVTAASPCSRGFGLMAPTDLAPLLSGIELDFIRLRLDAGADAPVWAGALASLVIERRLESAALDIDLGYDPVALAARGYTPDPAGAEAVSAAALKAGLAGRPLMADGRPWHEAGAGEARELALVLAAAVAHMRALEIAGLALDTARRKIAVLLCFDADMLLGLAKARAMRRLWARLEVACGLEPVPLRLHAETSWRMMTRYDPWTNAMRTTAATFAAGLGGADSITVLPMTLALGLSDEAARRLARNTGRVLLDEANLGKVDDPAAGSGALEALTEELCRAAWSMFSEVERRGGVLAGLRDGSVAADLAADAVLRLNKVETLARGIVGTSCFPRLDGPAPGVLGQPRAPELASLERGLPCHRDAEPFEALRHRAEMAAEEGRRPTVFLAALGEPAVFGMRVAQATNLLAAAGVYTEPPPTAVRDLAATVTAFAASDASIACLCGHPTAYAEGGTTAVAALKQAGATLVLALGGDLEGAVNFKPEGEETLQVLQIVVETLLGSTLNTPPD